MIVKIYEEIELIARKEKHLRSIHRLYSFLSLNCKKHNIPANPILKNNQISNPKSTIKHRHTENKYKIVKKCKESRTRNWPFISQETALNRGGFRDIIRNEWRIRTTQQNIGRKFTAYYGNVGREMHPHHTQHCSPSWQILKLTHSFLFLNTTATTFKWEQSKINCSGRRCCVSAIHLTSAPIASLLCPQYH